MKDRLTFTFFLIYFRTEHKITCPSSPTLFDTFFMPSAKGVLLETVI